MAVTATLLEAKTRITPEDFLNLPDGGKGFELVDGELKELNVSFESTYVAGEIFGVLRDFVKPRRLGWVSPEGTAYRCFPEDPDRIRKADVSFHLLARVTTERAKREGYFTIVPDLVVEVISPNDLSYEVERKRHEWLDAGVQLVWVVHPEVKTIHAYGTDGSTRLYQKTDTLTAEPLLPEFRVSVADLFTMPTESKS